MATTHVHAHPHLCLASEESKQAALVIEDVAAGYGDIMAISGASATATPGSIIALVGPNGAGKSTLLKAIVGAVPLRHGRVAIGDAETVARRRALVAYVAQHESIEWSFPISVLEMVELGHIGRAPWQPWRGRGVRERAREALAAVEMADLSQRSIGALSGGQQQRVVLARALMHDAPLFLLDEPLSGVDPASGRLILDLLRRLASEGHTILMATHDVDEAATTADRVWGINRSLVADVPAAELLNPEVMRRVYGEHLVILAGGAVALGDQQR
ncbi:MAG: manganese/zinc/iron transport system binding protein [Chloroflexota bacterium]|jgi:manganese/zinc/iron transport system ATP- binding protein|nr:manganese/zinc/iron transport system binding protein [Chloroflexota bacterium]